MCLLLILVLPLQIAFLFLWVLFVCLFLPFRMPCSFLLKRRHDVLGGRNHDKQAFGAVVVGLGGRREGSPVVH